MTTQSQAEDPTTDRSRGDALVAVLNAGSSSLKYDLLTSTGVGVAGGTLEPIDPAAAYSDHAAAVDRALARLTQEVPDWRRRVVAVGHRVVHGGPNLWRPTRIDDALLAELARCVPLAPLHLPAALQAIRSARRFVGEVPHVAVFDTGFHRDLPAVARTYAIPSDLAERWAIRRYGFHGISCEYLLGRLGELEPGRRRAILLHLGAGASVTAVQDGRSVDTSMGFTPLEGLAMLTRCGDLDPAVPLYLQERGGMDRAAVAALLERESGLKGLSGTSGDFREIVAGRAAGEERAVLAFDLFAYRIRKYVGAYWAILGGLDALVFAGGIGERSPELRAAVVEPLAALGLRLDPATNAAGPAERRISPAEAPIAVWIIPTDEARTIARHALAFVTGAAGAAAVARGLGKLPRQGAD